MSGCIIIININIIEKELIEIITKLQQSVTAFENAYIIITGRNIELFNNHNIFDLTTFDIVDLLPFDVGQAFQLVQKIIPNNKDKSNHFIEAIKNLNKRMGILDKISGIIKEDMSAMAYHAEKEANPLYPVPKLKTQKELALENIDLLMAK